MQPTPYRLRAAMQFLRYRFHSLAIPAARHHACMHNPIGRPVSARCQFAHLLLFFVIVRCSHSQDLRHCLAPSPELTSFLILSPFHERSTSAAFLKGDRKRGDDDSEASWEACPTPRVWPAG